MFKKITILILVLSTQINAQVNLVMNPSFENYSMCPSSLGEINVAMGWYAFNGSPDYFNSCSSVPSIQTPGNDYGYQQPFSGNGYAGIITYYNSSLAREIIGGTLTSSLIIGQKYYFSFMTNRANGNIVGYSTNKMSLKLSKVNSYTTTTNVDINNSANYFSNTIITDTLNWTRIKGSFIADSSYKYIMLGNLFDDANTNITNQSPGIYAFYYIDNVCISTDSAFAHSYVTRINDFQLHEVEFKVYPNPCSFNLTIELEEDIQLEICDSYGNRINYNRTYFEKKIMIDCKQWSPGIYFIKANNVIRKLLITD